MDEQKVVSFIHKCRLYSLDLSKRLPSLADIHASLRLHNYYPHPPQQTDSQPKAQWRALAKQRLGVSTAT